MPGASLYPESWSPDGNQLLFTQLGGQTNVERSVVADIRILSLDGELTADQLIQSGNTSGHAMVSPNGRWVAYHSNLSGRMEIYAERFPELGSRQLISTSGGRAPLWSPDGSELFYRSIDGRQVLAVPISLEPTLSAGIAEVLFEGPYVASVAAVRPYHLAPDGERFLMIKAAGGETGDAQQAQAQVVLVLNWAEELRRLAPASQ